MYPLPARWQQAGLLGMALVFACLAAGASQTLSGRIVGVVDGDTVKALVAGNRQWRIRLAEIDAPEKRQPWGKRAKQALAAKIFGKEVRIVVTGQDRYGRWIGKIYLGDRDINREMVREGHAWAYRKYLRGRNLLDDEAEARREHRGLWSLPEESRIPPWKWRSKKHRRKIRMMAPAPDNIPRPSGRGQHA